jgi:hypothetical protein
MRMKSIATLAFATTVTSAALLVGAVAPRAGSLEALKGTYASTGEQVCLNTDDQNFDSSLQPVNPSASRIDSSGTTGLFTFDGRGTVTYNSTFVAIRGPAFIGGSEPEPTFTPSAITGSSTSGAGSTYEVEPDGQVTVTLVNQASATFVIQQFVLSGQLALDNKTLVLGITEPAVQKQTVLSAGVPTGVVR